LESLHRMITNITAMTNSPNASIITPRFLIKLGDWIPICCKLEDKALDEAGASVCILSQI
jgi:hypothetical protein